MPKYYNPKTQTLVESSETLSGVSLRLNVGEGKAEDIQLIGEEAPRGIKRPLCISERLGFGGLWTKQNYVSGLTGQEVTGHFDLSSPINRDLLLVKQKRVVEVGLKFTNTAEEEKAATPTPTP